VFDVTLTVTGGGTAVLNAITAKVASISMEVEGGEGAVVPNAAIPVCAQYIVDLPKQQAGRNNTETARVAAIRPCSYRRIARRDFKSR
jgi:hypothetical protein